MCSSNPRGLASEPALRRRSVCGVPRSSLRHECRRGNHDSLPAGTGRRRCFSAVSVIRRTGPQRVPPLSVNDAADADAARIASRVPWSEQRERKRHLLCYAQLQPQGRCGPPLHCRPRSAVSLTLKGLAESEMPTKVGVTSPGLTDSHSTSIIGKRFMQSVPQEIVIPPTDASCTLDQ